MYSTLKFSILMTLCLSLPLFGTTLPKQLKYIVTSAEKYVDFNGVVLVAEGDNILFHHAIGFADADNQTVLTTKHQFSPGSVTKEFTTVIMMMLKEKGLISYEDKIATYLPNLPQWCGEININHILTHTSGLGRIKFRPNITTRDVMDQLGSTQLAYQPGEGYSYGNFNLVLRALIIEKVTGESFGTYAKKTLFDPAGMRVTHSKTTIQPNSPMVAAGDLPTAINGVTVYSNALDLFKWERALWTYKFVSPEHLKSMVMKEGLSGRKGRAYFDFGSFRTDGDGALTRVYHDGSNPSHHTLVDTNLSNNTTITLISRDGRKSTLYELNRLISDCFEQKKVGLPASWWLQNQIKTKPIDTVLADFKKIDPDTFVVTEASLNDFGYFLGRSGKTHDALQVMKQNLADYPQSLNAHDSYAEILIKAKEFETAKQILQQGLLLAKKQNNKSFEKALRGYLNEIENRK